MQVDTVFRTDPDTVRLIDAPSIAKGPPDDDYLSRQPSDCSGASIPPTRQHQLCSHQGCCEHQAPAVCVKHGDHRQAAAAAAEGQAVVLQAHQRVQEVGAVAVQHTLGAGRVWRVWRGGVGGSEASGFRPEPGCV